MLTLPSLFLSLCLEIVLNTLNIEMNVNEEKYMEDWHRERMSASLVLRMEEYIQSKVLRSSTAGEHGTPHSDNENVPSTSNHDFAYDAHPMELTESSDHLDPAVSTDYAGNRRRDSLFDYGGNNN